MGISIFKKIFGSVLTDNEQTINKYSKKSDYTIVLDVTGGTGSDKTGLLSSLENVILEHQTKGDFPFQFNLETFPRRVHDHGKKQIDIEFDPNNGCLFFKKFDKHGRTPTRTNRIPIYDGQFNNLEEYYQYLMPLLHAFLNGTLSNDLINSTKQNLLENMIDSKTKLLSPDDK